MSELKIALRRAGDPTRVEVAMVTVDPDRDGPILADYVGSFFPGGRALVTDDDALLAQVAAPFGASYLVSTDDDGAIEVAHSTALYAVDDAGLLLMTWPFGIDIDEMAADIEDLLDSVVHGPRGADRRVHGALEWGVHPHCRRAQLVLRTPTSTTRPPAANIQRIGMIGTRKRA
jgi:hypothetical protein